MVGTVESTQRTEDFNVGNNRSLRRRHFRPNWPLSACTSPIASLPSPRNSKAEKGGQELEGHDLLFLPKIQRFTLKNTPAAITRRPNKRAASMEVCAAPNNPR